MSSFVYHKENFYRKIFTHSRNHTNGELTMKKIIIFSAIIFSAASMAATEVTFSTPLPAGKNKIGSVSYSNPNASTSEIIQGLSDQADKMGGAYFKITSLEVASNSRGTAIVYK
ncbi:DUF1471 domain-containing protein [Serratia marcescens]|jgi:hypothetical protein|uniref:DUF1471 domain-containing protein n=2 Tax=Serratia TaxID=613 RepID=UPI0009B293BF|nr:MULTISPECIES: DUF1471 domain-containing protein [Serratia]MBH3097063.1 DUF1471 domain-containing protein [Serratia marcescens]MBH3218828.1 DUF1471 domain-containing protein [Serratia marcescens]PNU34754.1 DUF1471 domain-containing protein [Serratia marcescens]POP22640.1 DUF1471 domain-containing protein [Serratia marcescens]POP27298.1 DUF1471 domain-containing protein [Serratia marcescens]